MSADVQHRFGRGAQVEARLCNFPTGHEFLLPSHENFLDQFVGPVVRANEQSWVELYGYASHLGSAKYNMELSLARCQETQRWISQYRPDVHFRIVAGYGEAESTGGARDDDGFWRAVQVMVFAAPRPKPPVPVKKPVNTKFRVRMLANLSAGEVVVLDQSLFEIHDDENQLSSFYQYAGAGGGFGLLPLSGTRAGPWNSFETTALVQTNDFGGSAHFTTLGVGSLSKNYLHLGGLPNGATTKPHPISMNTGVTLGLGGTISKGGMMLQRMGTSDGLIVSSGTD